MHPLLARGPLTTAVTMTHADGSTTATRGRVRVEPEDEGSLGAVEGLTVAGADSGERIGGRAGGRRRDRVLRAHRRAARTCCGLTDRMVLDHIPTAGNDAMKASQTLTLRLSEIRQRLNEISGLDTEAVTEEVRAEAATLTTEFVASETKFRAALVAEGEEEARAAGEFGAGDGTPAEVRALMGRVSVASYLGPAAAGLGLTGAAVELASALEVPAVGPGGGVAIPWAVLAGPEVRQAPQTRAFSTTANNDGPLVQRPILGRLFGPGIMDTLGVRIDSVPTGMSEWSLITGVAAPLEKVEGTASGAAVAATFDQQTLKPKRLTGQAGVHVGARRDRAGYRGGAAARSRRRGEIARMEVRDHQRRRRGGAHHGLPHPHRGPGRPGGHVEAFEDYAGESFAAAVDGIHAGMETEVSSVIGVASYTHAAERVPGGDRASPAPRRSGAGPCGAWRLPTSRRRRARTTSQKSNLFHAAGPNGGAMRGDSIAAVWPTLEIVAGHLQPGEPGGCADVGGVVGLRSRHSARTPMSGSRSGTGRNVEPEVRAGGEFRVQGRVLTGTALRYGDVAPEFRERFEPGSLAPVTPVALNLQHDSGLIILPAGEYELIDGPESLEVRAELPERSAAIQLVRRRALSGFSIEFKATRERRDATGIRVVEGRDLDRSVPRGPWRLSGVESRAPGRPGPAPRVALTWPSTRPR